MSDFDPERPRLSDLLDSGKVLDLTPFIRPTGPQSRAYFVPTGDAGITSIAATGATVDELVDWWRVLGEAIGITLADIESPQRPEERHW